MCIFLCHCSGATSALGEGSEGAHRVFIREIEMWREAYDSPVKQTNGAVLPSGNLT